MPRYIDAEFAEKEITSLVAEYENRMPEWSPDDMLTSGKDAAMKYGYKADGAEKALEIVNKIPTADVQEVKHGNWIDKGVLENYPRPDINVYHLLCCSECGALHRVRPYCEGGWINASYCPNCGAKMDGDNNGKDNSC